MRRRRALAVLLLVVAVVSSVLLVLRERGANAAQTSRPGSARGEPVRGQQGGAAAPLVMPTVAPTPSGRAQTPAPQSGLPDDGLPGDGLLGEVSGLGPRALATVPVRTTKVVVVKGDSPTAITATIELYSLRAGAWHRAGAWRGHIGAKGWTAQHREGDLRTPIGTYTLSDAGGRLPNPGTRLPYHVSDQFIPTGDGVFGDSLAGSFDYVVAVDFNRRTGVSPLDQTRPRGRDAGGGIWLHVDHPGPTHGCVSIPRAGMQALLRALAPGDHPIVVMADRARLAA